MPKREIEAIAKILTDPENSSRTAEEVAELCLGALTDYVKQVRADEVDRIAKKVVESIEGERVGGIPVRIADAIDRMRQTTHRLAVVGQIQYGPQETHTVVLGPFSARGILDTQEKFRKAAESGGAARDAGQHLAWDSKTGIGRGRFMLAPAFRRPQDAWDFFRGPTKRESEPMNLLVSPPAHTAAAVARWEAGLWAEEHHQTPRP
jgi:hypothetical protein